ncbi:hypothetical protein CI102_14489 [Trichoderma harzianum]|nr:hypothetical protein CI102_14489 [Trichoderma harzianum]
MRKRATREPLPGQQEMDRMKNAMEWPDLGPGRRCRVGKLRLAGSCCAGDDWEDWEDDDVVTLIDVDETPSADNSDKKLLFNSAFLDMSASNSAANTRSPSPLDSDSASLSMRRSAAKINRPISRKPPKQRNAKLGIKLITDMTKLRRQNHIAGQAKSPARRAPKFVDAAALRALEGSPNPQSVGNWNWLNKDDEGRVADSPLQATRSPAEQLSPEDRPIVIGITLPSDEVTSRGIDPLTATVNNIDTPGGMKTPYPFTFQATNNRANAPAEPHQLTSVWSPDTPETASSFSTVRYPSSVYSQASMAPVMGYGPRDDEVPPVPAVPANYKRMTAAHQRLVGTERRKNAEEEEESGTPCTLFEEDGVTPLKSPASKLSALTPQSVRGWWDHHLVTPFLDKRMSFASRRTQMESPLDERAHQMARSVDNQGSMLTPKYVASPQSWKTPKIPTPRRTPSPRGNVSRAEVVTESVRGDLKHDGSDSRDMVHGLGITNLAAHNPPPSSSEKQAGDSIKYQAVFPPDHHLHTQFSPREAREAPTLATSTMSKAVTSTTTSTTASTTASTKSTNTLPIAAPSAPAAPIPLPARPVGTSLSQSHAEQLSGKEYKIERKRRRHEKEEMAARRAGGFWRGRGCMPKKGCFGRPGPEGRKKRRIWLCIICILLLLIIILAVVLGVVLGRHHGSGNKTETSGQDPPPSTSSSTPSAPIPSSIWVNLTDYPAMPTGVLTFVGPNNTIAKSDCTEPSTLWSCSLPKDSQASVLPFKPNQPTLIFQIQWDNSTKRGWNIPNGTPPTAISQRDTSNSNSSIDGFNPDPSPPTFQEMWFLGETTDNIQSSQKAGEPTPFFISILESLNDTVKSPTLSRRATASDVNISDIIFPPDLQEDGTPAPAVMLPSPVQQPVRLFDRGLPTEHYGFYTYFQRTIFLKSVTVLNDSSRGNVPVDEDGGCSETEANHLVTWAETRMLVQIWTRKLNSTASLLTADGTKGIDNSAELIKPGTMPYPVTVTLDTHGGDPNHKVVWEWPMDDRQKLNTSAPDLLVNKMDVGGTWINHRGSGNAKFGGFDGGTGGCKIRTKQRSLVTLAIETSCDDTAVAVLEKSAGGRTKLLFNERVSSDNRAFKGIHPMVTVEGHNTALGPLVERALESLRESEDDVDGSSAVVTDDKNIKKWKKKIRVPDFVCATRGPGIMTNLSVGLNVAKGLALAWDVPFVGVHHMQAHALTPRLVDALESEQGQKEVLLTSTSTSRSPPPSPTFPFLSLLVSGGHTQLILSTTLTNHRILATTGDIAIGNLLDQTARVILPPALLESSPDVMYGRLLEAFAFPPGADTPADYDAFFTPAASRQDEIQEVPSGYGWTVPLPFRNSRKLAYSFSSIHSHVHNIAAAANNRNTNNNHHENDLDSSSSSFDNMPLEERRALARHTLRAAFQHLASRLILALQDSPSLQPSSSSSPETELIKTIVVAGGVASNRFLMHVLRTTLAARGFADMRIVSPPLELCTDNAAMIAWAGMEMFEAGYRTELSVRPIAKWPMDPDVGGGILGAGGWTREEE